MHMIAPIRVLLADDHPLIRSGISTMLSTYSDIIELVGEATNAHEAHFMTCDPDFRPDVLLLDLNMPGPSPLETIAIIREKCPNVKVIVLTGHSEDAYVRALVGFGIEGYIFKDEATEVIIQAIHTVVSGGTWFSQSVVTKLMRWKTSTSRQNAGLSLTNRELDILQLVVRGYTDQKISQELGIADRTVRYNLQVIYTKLEVKTRIEAAVKAVQLKLAGTIAISTQGEHI